MHPTQIWGPIHTNSGVCDLQSRVRTLKKMLSSAFSHSGWYGCTERVMCFELKRSQFESLQSVTISRTSLGLVSEHLEPQFSYLRKGNGSISFTEMLRERNEILF